MNTYIKYNENEVNSLFEGTNWMDPNYKGLDLFNEDLSYDDLSNINLLDLLPIPQLNEDNIITDNEDNSSNISVSEINNNNDVPLTKPKSYKIRNVEILTLFNVKNYEFLMIENSYNIFKIFIGNKKHIKKTISDYKRKSGNIEIFIKFELKNSLLYREFKVLLSKFIEQKKIKKNKFKNLFTISNVTTLILKRNELILNTSVCSKYELNNIIIELLSKWDNNSTYNK